PPDGVAHVHADARTRERRGEALAAGAGPAIERIRFGLLAPQRGRRRAPRVRTTGGEALEEGPASGEEEDPAACPGRQIAEPQTRAGAGVVGAAERKLHLQ